MERKLVFDIAIESNGPAVHLSSETGAVDMIPFGGTVRGEIFQGIVEPCGVDTQVLNQAGVRHMSARYMLKRPTSTWRTTAGSQRARPCPSTPCPPF